MPRMTLDLELRGQKVEIDCNARPPEYDVGIAGWYSEEEIVRDADGKELAWELTDAELEKISTAVAQSAWDGYFDDDYD